MRGLRVPAGLRARALAALIDGALVAGVLALTALVLAALGILAGGIPDPLLLTAGVAAAAAVCLVVLAALQGGRGSVGMRLTGVRLAHADDDQDLGFGRALARLVVWGAGSAVVVGLFSPLFDRSAWRRGWHDRATRALVVGGARSDAVGPERTPDRAFVQAVARSASPVLIAPVAAASPVIPPRPPLPATRAVDLPPAPVAPAARVDSWAPARGIPLPGTAALITSVPGVSGRAPAAVLAKPVTDPAPALALLTWDDGTRQAVYERTLFGRNPAAEPGALTVAVRDETLSLSKTHFEIGRDDRGTWFVDRHSTNGAVIVRAGRRARLVAGERVLLRAGDVLELGDRRLTVGSVR